MAGRNSREGLSNPVPPLGEGSVEYRKWTDPDVAISGGVTPSSLNGGNRSVPVLEKTVTQQGFVWGRVILLLGLPLIIIGAVVSLPLYARMACIAVGLTVVGWGAVALILLHRRYPSLRERALATDFGVLDPAHPPGRR